MVVRFILLYAAFDSVGSSGIYPGALLEASRASLGPVLDHLGSILGYFGPVFCHLGSILGDLSLVLDLSWDIFTSTKYDHIVRQVATSMQHTSLSRY